MSADHLHFIRHGQVFNPEGVIYERIEGFGLSDMGWKIASIAADKHHQMNITRVISSPLQRARESVKPWLDNTGLELEVDARVIENWNKMKGLRPGFSSLLKKPAMLRHFHNPKKPSWAEPYVEIQARMLDAAKDLWDSTDSGDVVIVSHQLPIVMLQRTAQGLPLAHDPRKRQCELSSISSFKFTDDKLELVSYSVPWMDAGVKL